MVFQLLRGLNDVVIAERAPGSMSVRELEMKPAQAPAAGHNEPPPLPQHTQNTKHKIKKSKYCIYSAKPETDANRRRLQQR